MLPNRGWAVQQSVLWAKRPKGKASKTNQKRGRKRLFIQRVISMQKQKEGSPGKMSGRFFSVGFHLGKRNWVKIEGEQI